MSLARASQTPAPVETLTPEPILASQVWLDLTLKQRHRLLRALIVVCHDLSPVPSGSDEEEPRE